MYELLKNFVNGDSGTTAVEYAVMLALILAVVIGSISAFGMSEGEGWSRISNSLSGYGVGS